MFYLYTLSIDLTSRGHIDYSWLQVNLTDILIMLMYYTTKTNLRVNAMWSVAYLRLEQKMETWICTISVWRRFGFKGCFLCTWTSLSTIRTKRWWRHGCTISVGIGLTSKGVSCLPEDGKYKFIRNLLFINSVSSWGPPFQFYFIMLGWC